MKKHICSCCTIELVNTGTWNIRNPRKSSFAKMFRKRAGGKRFLFPLLSSTSLLLLPPRESLCRFRTLNAIKKKKKEETSLEETLYARLSRPATNLGREERRERVSSTAFPRLVRSLWTTGRRCRRTDKTTLAARNLNRAAWVSRELCFSDWMQRCRYSHLRHVEKGILQPVSSPR